MRKQPQRDIICRQICIDRTIKRHGTAPDQTAAISLLDVQLVNVNDVILHMSVILCIMYFIARDAAGIQAAAARDFWIIQRAAQRRLRRHRARENFISVVEYRGNRCDIGLVDVHRTANRFRHTVIRARDDNSAAAYAGLFRCGLLGSISRPLRLCRLLSGIIRSTGFISRRAFGLGALLLQVTASNPALEETEILQIDRIGAILDKTIDLIERNIVQDDFRRCEHAREGRRINGAANFAGKGSLARNRIRRMLKQARKVDLVNVDGELEFFRLRYIAVDIEIKAR